MNDFREIFGDENHKYPLWIGKILYKKLLSEKIFFTEFMEKDGRFVVEKIAFDTKRKIVKILQKVREVAK